MVPLLFSHNIIVQAFRPKSTIMMINRSSSISSSSSSSSSRLSLLNRNKGVIPVPISTTTSRLLASVTGTVYTAEDSGEANNNNNIVVVTLYTKEGCTLCDKVKDVLQNQISQNEYPHTLKQIDITDNDNDNDNDNDTNQNQKYETYYDRYKYDIPVLHIGYENENNNDSSSSSSSNNDRSVYWTKHRLDVEEAKLAFKEAMEGTFQPRKGRPNATAMER